MSDTDNPPSVEAIIRRAKAENDERFMLEHDEARAEVVRLQARLAKAEGLLRQVADAVNIVGPSPLIHLREREHLRRNWPTLWRAVAAITAKSSTITTLNGVTSNEHDYWCTCRMCGGPSDV